MLIQYTMVPLPTTADEKFAEAGHFFSRMITTRTNVREMPFNFSAFLAAIRSVTLYLQEQHRGNPKFEAWYSGKQEEMRADPDLKLLKDLRDEALHARKINLLISQGPKLPEEGLQVFEAAFDTDPKGNMRTSLKLEKAGPDVPFESVAHWQFQLAGQPNVFEVCDRALRKIRDLLDECRTVVSDEAGVSSG